MPVSSTSSLILNMRVLLRTKKEMPDRRPAHTMIMSTCKNDLQIANIDVTKRTATYVYVQSTQESRKRCNCSAARNHHDVGSKARTIGTGLARNPIGTRSAAPSTPAVVVIKTLAPIEEGHCHASPDATEAVNWAGIHRVINLQLLGEAWMLPGRQILQSIQ